MLKKRKKVEKMASSREMIEKMLGQVKMSFLDGPLKAIKLSKERKPEKVTWCLSPFIHILKGQKYRD